MNHNFQRPLFRDLLMDHANSAVRPPEGDKLGTPSGRLTSAAVTTTHEEFIDQSPIERRQALASDSRKETAEKTASNAVTAAKKASAGGASRHGGGLHPMQPPRVQPPPAVNLAPAVDLFPVQSSQAHHGNGGGGKAQLKFSYDTKVVQKFRQANSEYRGRESHDLELKFWESPSQRAKDGLMEIMKKNSAPWKNAGPKGQTQDCMEKTNSGVNPRNANQADMYLVFKYSSATIQTETKAKALKYIQGFVDEEGVRSLCDMATVSLGAFSPSLHAHRVHINRSARSSYTFEGKSTDQEQKQRKITLDGKAWNKVLEKLSPKVTTVLDEAESDHLDFRAVFKNQGQYGLQLGVLVFSTPEEAQMVADAIDGEVYSAIKISAKVEEQPIEIKSRDLQMHVETWPAEVEGLSALHRADLKVLRGHLNQTITQKRYKGAFGCTDSEPIVAVVTDRTGLTVVHLRNARMRMLITSSYKSMFVTGLSTRISFRGPSDAISKVSIDQRRRVRSQSAEDSEPMLLSPLEEGEVRSACQTPPLGGETLSKREDAMHARRARDEQAATDAGQWRTVPDRAKNVAAKGVGCHSPVAAAASTVVVQRNSFGNLPMDDASVVAIPAVVAKAGPARANTGAMEMMNSGGNADADQTNAFFLAATAGLSPRQISDSINAASGEAGKQYNKEDEGKQYNKEDEGDKEEEDNDEDEDEDAVEQVSLALETEEESAHKFRTPAGKKNKRPPSISPDSELNGRFSGQLKARSILLSPPSGDVPSVRTPMDQDQGDGLPAPGGGGN